MARRWSLHILCILVAVPVPDTLTLLPMKYDGLDTSCAIPACHITQVVISQGVKFLFALTCQFQAPRQAAATTTWKSLISTRVRFDPVVSRLQGGLSKRKTTETIDNCFIYMFTSQLSNSRP